MLVSLSASSCTLGEMFHSSQANRGRALMALFQGTWFIVCPHWHSSEVLPRRPRLLLYCRWEGIPKDHFGVENWPLRVVPWCLPVYLLHCFHHCLTWGLEAALNSLIKLIENRNDAGKMLEECWRKDRGGQMASVHTTCQTGILRWSVKPWWSWRVYNAWDSQTSNWWEGELSQEAMSSTKTTSVHKHNCIARACTQALYSPNSTRTYPIFCPAGNGYASLSLWLPCPHLHEGEFEL